MSVMMYTLITHLHQSDVKEADKMAELSQFKHGAPVPTRPKQKLRVNTKTAQGGRRGHPGVTKSD